MPSASAPLFDIALRLALKKTALSQRAGTQAAKRPSARARSRTRRRNSNWKIYFRAAASFVCEYCPASGILHLTDFRVPAELACVRRPRAGLEVGVCHSTHVIPCLAIRRHSAELRHCLLARVVSRKRFFQVAVVKIQQVPQIPRPALHILLGIEHVSYAVTFCRR